MQAPIDIPGASGPEPLGAARAPAATIPAPDPIEVLVVDADRRVRAALSSLIGLAPNLALIGSVGYVAAAVAALEARTAAVVVLDPKLPDVDAGRALIRLIRDRWPTVGIVVLTWSDPIDAADAEAPADRYLAKTVAPIELIATLQSFGAGRPLEAGSGASGVQ